MTNSGGATTAKHRFARAAAGLRPGSGFVSPRHASGVRGRERSSIGHELGHWNMHRGSSFSCRVDDPDSNLMSNKPREEGSCLKRSQAVPRPGTTASADREGLP